MTGKSEKSKSRLKPKTKREANQTLALRPKYNQDEVRRLLGDQREGFSIPAGSWQEGASSIFGVEFI
jgi:hypothetical protein